MSTLTTVLQLPDQDSDASIACRIVSIHLFHSDKSILLTVVLIDRDGKTFEAKAWSANKAYYVYFNFKEGQYVQLRCPPALFTHVDERFSRSAYEIQRRNWFLEPSKHSFQPKNPFPACYDIATFYKSQTPVKSVVAMFLEMSGGPKKYGPDGRVVARGHYTKFKDSKNRIFQVLLWEIANRKFKFPLRDCKVGDYVLLPYAREQPERYRSSKIYTITTLYPPVVQSQCVDVTKTARLLKNHATYECEPFNPYE